MCLEKFEGADVKYNSTVAFSSSSPKTPKQNVFEPTLKKPFLKEILHFGKLKVLKSSKTIASSISSLKIAKRGIFCAKFEVLSTYMNLCLNLNLRAEILCFLTSSKLYYCNGIFRFPFSRIIFLAFTIYFQKDFCIQWRSNYRMLEIIFLMRWIPNGMALFQKTRAFKQIFMGTKKKSK